MRHELGDAVDLCGKEDFDLFILVTMNEGMERKIMRNIICLV